MLLKEKHSFTLSSVQKRSHAVKSRAMKAFSISGIDVFSCTKAGMPVALLGPLQKSHDLAWK